jgi:hypothetical protein
MVHRCSTADWVAVIEMVTCFHAYLATRPLFWREGDVKEEDACDKACRIVSQQITSTLCRDGYRWKTAKFHSCFLHFAHHVGRFGSITNMDAEVGESGLKVWAKQPGRRTNKGGTDGFMEQTANRVFERKIFNHSNKILDTHDDGRGESDDEKGGEPKCAGLDGNAKYRISHQYHHRDRREGVSYHGIVCKWLG